MSAYPPVESLVPHRPPMLLIDRITGCSERELTAEVRISPAAPFFEAPIGVPAWFALEYMGQAAAAWFGMHARDRGGAAAPGMLIACRRFETELPAFPDGALLRVSIAPASASAPPTPARLVRFKGEVHMPQTPDPVARGELSVYMDPRA